MTDVFGSRRARLGPVLVAVAALWAVLCPGPATAREEVAPFGLSHNAVLTGVLGQSSRVYDPATGKKWEGKQFYVNFEGGAFAKVSPLGNLGGLEAVCAMGYDGATADMEQNHPKSGLVGGFLFDFGIGFPFSVFHYFSDSKDRFQLLLSPGFGISHMHAYLYVKTKAALQVTSDIAAELQWQWWPGPTSLMWSSNYGINQSSIKGQVYLGSYGKQGWAVFGEYLWSELEEEKPGDPVKGAFGDKNPFTKTIRSDFESSLRIGVGAAF